MLYPRVTKNGKLVDVNQLVGFREHLATKSRIIALQGEMVQEIDSTMTLFGFDSISQDPIKIIIDSPGGVLDSAFMFYDNMKLLSSPIYTLGRYVCSAAVIPLAAGKKRYLMPHAKIMLHLPSGTCGGDANDWEIQKKEMDNYKNQMIDILQECGVKKKKAAILKDLDRDFWLSPKEAIEYGLADEIIDQKTLREWLK